MKSGSLSGKFTNVVAKLIYKDGGTKKEIKELDHVVRKCAHFSIYLIGGMLIFNFLGLFCIGLKRKIIFSQGLGVLYAITDEVHQLFVMGRGAKPADVFIDSCGVFIGLFVVVLYKCYRNRSKLNIGLFYI